jgi:hypothetical protein
VSGKVLIADLRGAEEIAKSAKLPKIAAIENKNLPQSAEMPRKERFIRCSG